MYTCDERKGAEHNPLTMIYEGDEKGSLKVTGSFGEMILTATKQTREGPGDGVNSKVTGIRAWGPATIRMPDKAALESCVVSRRPGGQADVDIDTMSILGCSDTLPAQTPVAITASIEIALMDGSTLPVVFMRRTYAEKSRVVSEPLTIESVPPPDCKPQ